MFGNTLSTLSGRTRPFDAVLSAAGKIILGKETEIRQALACLLADGHLLIEDLPGMGKTTLAHALARLLGLQFSRVQFTSDLLPADITGVSIFDREKSEFRFLPGPVFAQLVLADEINRATPKTQAALLQAMNERTVSIDGADHRLGSDFTVIATQNPIEQQGTYPLPEAQLDRFLFKIVIEFPPEPVEMAILKSHAAQPIEAGLETAGLAQVLDAVSLAESRGLIDGIILKDDILAYILRLVRATRTNPEISHGASTRAADALAQAARAFAALSGRDFAIPDDVKRLFIPALRHRIVLGPAAEIEGRDASQVLQNILNQIEAPR